MNRPWLNSYDEEVPRTIKYPNIPLFNFFDVMAEKYPLKPCTTFQNDQISYGEMHQLVNALASGLAACGVKKGDRVGLMMGNIPQFVLGFYSILKAGGIVVAINPLYKENELLFQLSDSGCSLLIALMDCFELLKKIRQELPLEKVIFTDVGDAFKLKQIIQSGSNMGRDQKVGETDINLLTLIGEHKNDIFGPPAVTSESEAIFQYSGGTTGIPKAAIGLHKNLVANTIQFRNWLVNLEEAKESVLVAIPLYHVYGMVIAMSMGIALAANLVLIPNPRNIEDVLLNIQKYKTTMFPGVPNMYQAINQYPAVREGKYDLSSIKACISGSAPLLKTVKEDFENLTGGRLMEGYGLSEAPTATHCNPLIGENRVGSIGLPLPDVNCRIVSLEDGVTDLPAGETGELVIQGPQIMKEYHNMPAETAIALRNRWLYTGDIAKMDKDGYFYLIDRKKDVIKPGGFQVWPREVEEVISRHPSVQEVAVAGVLHPEKGEMVRAWVVLREGRQVAGGEIISWCRHHLVGYKVPGEVEFVGHLPRTNVGKILRRELVRQYEKKGSKH